VIFYFDLCLRSYGVDCVKCIESCPHGALSAEDKLSINPLLCTECGICQRVCPNEAIVVKPLTHIRDNRCEGLGGSIPCAGYLDGELAKALGLKEVEICERCPKGADADAVAAGLAKAGVAVKRGKPVDLRRRRLLTGPPSWEVRSGRGEPPLRLKLVGPRSGCIEVVSCVFCGVCAGVCPTGALREEGLAIRFSPDKCTGCGLCAAYCKHGEIRVGAGCVSFEIRPEKRCVQCGRPFIGEGDVCPFCREVDRELSLLILGS